MTRKRDRISEKSKRTKKSRRQRRQSTRHKRRSIEGALALISNVHQWKAIKVFYSFIIFFLFPLFFVSTSTSLMLSQMCDSFRACVRMRCCRQPCRRRTVASTVAANDNRLRRDIVTAEYIAILLFSNDDNGIISSSHDGKIEIETGENPLFFVCSCHSHKNRLP